MSAQGISDMCCPIDAMPYIYAYSANLLFTGPMSC